jgi:hypothetical protein
MCEVKVTASVRCLNKNTIRLILFNFLCGT